MNPVADGLLHLHHAALDAGAALIRIGGKRGVVGYEILAAASIYKQIAEELQNEPETLTAEDPGFN